MNKIKQYYEQYREMINYLIFGVLTTLVNVIVFYIFDTILGLPYLIANAVSIIVSILFAYVTNKRYVFESKAIIWQEQLKEFLLFIGVRAGTGIFDMLSMWVFVSLLHIDTNFAKLLTQFVVVVLNYAFSKLVVFK